jgi:hypothetical protein
LKQNFFGLGNLWIRDAAVVYGADGLALYIVKVAHAFGAAIIGDDINRIAFPISFGDFVAFGFGVASDFKDGFVGALWNAGTTIDALFGNFN